MRGEESRDPFCNILSENLRLQRLKDSIITARCLVDSRLIDAKFVSCSDRASSSHVSLMSGTLLHLLRLPPLFLHTASDQKLDVGTAWE